ncbi:MAG: GAF domain-containing protein [Candidatus Sericytochromatia bacterium]|nr:GAF domain-containing protein [Candidatus Sericytochromatia bacterium]
MNSTQLALSVASPAVPAPGIPGGMAWTSPKWDWFAVAEGIGSEGKGDAAMAGFIASLGQANQADIPLVSRIEDALNQANEQLYQLNKLDASLKGVGFSATIGAVLDGKLQVWHVGATKAYRRRDGQLTQLTNDHTVAGLLVQQNKLAVEQAATHPGRNAMLRYVGKSVVLNLQHDEHEVVAGDRFVFCSQSLGARMTLEAVAVPLKAETHEQLARDLVTAATDTDGSKLAAVIADAVVVESVAGPAPATEAQAADNQRLDIFLAFSQKAASCQSIDHLFDLILRDTLNLCQVERSLLLERSSDGELQVKAKHGLKPLGDTQLFSKTIANDVFATGNGFFAADVIDDPGVDLSRSIQSLSLRSIICLPFRAAGKVIAVLYADRAGMVAQVVQKDYDLVEAFLLYGQLFYANLSLIASQQQKITNMELLESLNLAVASQVEPEAIFHHVLQTCLAITQADKGYILVGADSQARVSIDLAGNTVAPGPIDTAVLTLVRANGKAVMSHVSTVGTEAGEPCTLIVVPLVVRKRLHGVVYLKFDSTKHNVSNDDFRFVQQIAQHAGVHLESAAVFDELQRFSSEVEAELVQVAGANQHVDISDKGTLTTTLGVAAVLRQLHKEGQSGTLSLKGRLGQGQVTVRQGTIVQANSQTWGLANHEALGELFSWLEGEWTWDTSVVSDQRDMERLDTLFVSELRAAQTWQSIHGQIGATAIPRRAAGSETGLSAEERLLNGLVDDKRQVLEIVRLSKMPVIDALSGLLRLRQAAAIVWNAG